MTEAPRRIRMKVAGERMVETLKTMVHEGNIRRIIIKSENDRTILEIPLTFGVVGAMLLPVWVALGAIAALAAHYTIEVEKVEPVAAPAPRREEVNEPVGSF
jgi:hypothetical protein